MESLIQQRAHLYDADFDAAEVSYDELEEIFGRMNEIGYTIGLDEDWRNEWWPPASKEEQQ